MSRSALSRGSIREAGRHRRSRGTQALIPEIPPRTPTALVLLITLKQVYLLIFCIIELKAKKMFIDKYTFFNSLLCLGISTINCVKC